MEEKILEEIGLTKGESKVYLSLLTLGNSKSGEIIKKSRLQSSVVFNCLKALAEKGMINSIKKGGIKEYHAVSPKVLIDFLDEKKNKLKEILPKLKEVEKRERQEAEVYYGVKGIKAAHYEQVKNAKKGDEYLFFSLENEYYNEEAETFLRHFNNFRKEKGMAVKALIKTNPEKKKIFEKEFSEKGINFRRITQEIPLGMAIYKDTILQIVWDKEPVAFLLKSRKLSEQYRKFFYTLWKK